jgi:hypothetical protein
MANITYVEGEEEEMSDTIFQLNAQVFLVTQEPEGAIAINEWAGPIPPVGNRIKLIDGDTTRSFIVSGVEWVTVATGDWGADAIVAPSEIYIHTKRVMPLPGLAYRSQDAEIPEFVSSDRGHFDAEE